MSNEIDQFVADYLKEIGIVYHAQFVANMDHNKEWQHDLWSVMFDREIKPSYGDGQLPKYTPAKAQRFDFKTGTGLRKSNKYGEKKPVSPSAASVLYCLLSDADAINYSFSDWCDNFGYSSDSISALNIYQACGKTADQLAKLFTRQHVAKLQELLQDY